MTIHLNDNSGGRQAVTGLHANLTAAFEAFANSFAGKNGRTLELDGDKMIQRYADGTIQTVYTITEQLDRPARTARQPQNKLFEKYNVSRNLNTKMDSEFCDF